MPLDLASLYQPEEEDEFNNPKQFASSIGLIDSYPSDPGQQLNYLDDSFGTFTSKLPIDQPSGSIVSGGREDLYHKYSQMLEQKPESERVLEDYMGRRPSREQYGNSIGRKLLTGLVGAGEALRGGGARAYSVESKILDDPYNQAMQDYNSEGKYVNEYAKQVDSSRNRQLSSLLSQMRMDEVQRANREREKQTGILRGIQQGGLDERREAGKRSEEEKKYRHGVDERRLGLEERRVRRLESLGGGRGESREEKLDPFQKAGLRKYEQLTKPDEKMPERKMRLLIGQDPSLVGLFEDPEKLVPRSNLNPNDQAKLKQLIQQSQFDDRLLQSLGFGE